MKRSNLIIGVMILSLGITVSACQKKDEAGKAPVKAVKMERVVPSEQVTVGSLDKRVTVLEQRNREVDAAVRRKRAALKVAQ